MHVFPCTFDWSFPPPSPPLVPYWGYQVWLVSSSVSCCDFDKGRLSLRPVILKWPPAAAAWTPIHPSIHPTRAEEHGRGVDSGKCLHLQTFETLITWCKGRRKRGRDQLGNMMAIKGQRRDKGNCFFFFFLHCTTCLTPWPSAWRPSRGNDGIVAERFVGFAVCSASLQPGKRQVGVARPVATTPSLKLSGQAGLSQCGEWKQEGTVTNAFIIN